MFFNLTFIILIPYLCKAFINQNQLFRSAGNEVKAGKSFVFWGIDEEFHSVAVVGLGKKIPEHENIELISEEKELVRVAATGMKVLSLFLINLIILIPS